MNSEDDYEEDALNTSADIFANSSTDTVTESYPPPPFIDGPSEKLILSPNSQNKLDTFLAENNNPHRICCPFCIFDFGFEYILKQHITTAHPVEIKIILNAEKGEIDFYECPFCEAKFYHKDLLPKHVMRKHELCVVNMFSGFSPEKYVYCRFCPHKILRKHYKLLIIHIEKKHFQLFEKYVVDKFSCVSKNIDCIKSIQNENITSPELSLQMNKLTTEEQIKQSPPVKSILKPRTEYPIEPTEKVDNVMLNMEVSVLYANLEVKPNKNARRRLRFDIPSESEDKENGTTPCKKKKLSDNRTPKWLKFLRSKKQEDNDESIDARQLSNFKCGVCSEGFKKNSKLLEHVRKKHKGITLQAQYCCGDCDAKFYRNSFLRRHCKYHHSPLCLKSGIIKDQGKF